MLIIPLRDTVTERPAQVGGTPALYSGVPVQVSFHITDSTFPFSLLTHQENLGDIMFGRPSTI
jgi:hypothetical protein